MYRSFVSAKEMLAFVVRKRSKRKKWKNINITVSYGLRLNWGRKTETGNRATIATLATESIHFKRLHSPIPGLVCLSAWASPSADDAQSLPEAPSNNGGDNGPISSAEV